MNVLKNFIYKSSIAVLFLILFPIFFIISIYIFATSGWPIVYQQKRVGKRGQVFTLYKFRTMNVHADQMKSKLIKYNQAQGPVFKMYHDPRFTPFGKFLSHVGLDELPQIVNVFKGDMAFIGPRPLPVDEEAELTKWQKNRALVKPGIISPWIVNGYHTNSFDNWMRSDIEYTKNKNAKTDLILCIKAIRLFFKLVEQQLI